MGLRLGLSDWWLYRRAEGALLFEGTRFKQVLVSVGLFVLHSMAVALVLFVGRQREVGIWSLNSKASTSWIMVGIFLASWQGLSAGLPSITIPVWVCANLSALFSLCTQNLSQPHPALQARPMVFGEYHRVDAEVLVQR